MAILPNRISSFKDLPLNARNYILMHTIGSPLMIGEYALVVYLLFTGYKLIEIGLIYTVMEIIVTLCPYLVGKMLDKGASIKKTMALVYMFEGIAFFLFFLFVMGGTQYFWLGFGCLNLPQCYIWFSQHMNIMSTLKRFEKKLLCIILSYPNMFK